MIIFPALDLRGGKVVRLRGGDPKRETIYADDPLAMAFRWISLGAEWLHVVNLDGALAQHNDNERILEHLAETGVPIQFGGGLRSFDDVQRAFDLGASRVVLGTLAVESPDHIAAAVARWGAEHIAVALDSKDGKVAIHGWQRQSDTTAIELGKQFVGMGLKYALYTDVVRDGSLQGVNFASTVELATETGLHVIASGGISSLEDLRALKASGVVAGAVLGMSLYEGLVDLKEAIEATRG